MSFNLNKTVPVKEVYHNCASFQRLGNKEIAFNLDIFETFIDIQYKSPYLCTVFALQHLKKLFVRPNKPSFTAAKQLLNG